MEEIITVDSRNQRVVAKNARLMYRPWAFTARKSRIHAFLLAAVLWIVAVVITLQGSTNRNAVGRMKAADFAHFYTIGNLVRTGRSDLLYDITKQRQVQGELVPEAADLLFAPVYPPQMAIIFAPFSAFSYGHAALLWIAFTMACYAIVVGVAWAPVSAQLPDPLFLAAAAAAFPPFWQLVLHGQTTVIVLIAFFLGWLAMEKDRPFLAGCAFGLMAVKPQFGLPLAVVVLARRDWPMLLGAAASVMVQALIVYLLLDQSVFHGFLRMAHVAAQYPDLIEPRSFQTHSLRTITRLAPAWLELPLWIGASAGVLWSAARVWSVQVPVRLRLSAVIIASALVNPHLTVYDVTILVLPLIWVSAAVRDLKRPEVAWWYWSAIYGLFVTLFAPTAVIIGVQLSVLLMVWVFVQATRLCDESVHLAVRSRAQSYG